MDLSLCLELVNSFVDVFKIVTQLHTLPDTRLQDVLCYKLHEAKVDHIQFFLPQLCNIVLGSNSEYDVQYLMRFLLWLCTISLHLGFSIYFIFQSALSDYLSPFQSPEVVSNVNRIKNYIYLFCAAIIQSNEDIDMSNIVHHVSLEFDSKFYCSNIEKVISNIRPIDFVRLLNSNVLNVVDLSEFTKANVWSYCNRQKVGDGSQDDRCSMASLDDVDGMEDMNFVFTLSEVGGVDDKFGFVPEDVIEKVYGRNDGEINGFMEVVTDGGRDRIKIGNEGVNMLKYQILMNKSREKYFGEQMSFVYSLVEISNILQQLGIRKMEECDTVLQCILDEMESRFAGKVYLPLLKARNNGCLRVLKILRDESVTLSSKNKAPYVIFFEVDSSKEISNCDNFDSNDEFDLLGKNFDFTADDSDEDGVGLGDENMDGEMENEREYRSTSICIGDQLFLDRIYGESWICRKERIKNHSLFSSLQNWNLVSIIVKSGDDLRQEQLAVQIINIFNHIFRGAKLPIWLYPYEVLAVSSKGGFIETIYDAISIHSIKVKMQDISHEPGIPVNDSLRQYFQMAYSKDDLPEAQTNFAESLAGYSLICYILQIKDRHNGNILLDREGHIIHIDYGFMISTSPGSLGFESAPFKLTMDFISVLDGKESNIFKHFQNLFCNGFLALRKHYKSIMLIIEMMLSGSKIACLSKGPQSIKQLEDRFKINLTDNEAFSFAENLVRISERNWRTESYDMFQYYSNGIKQ